MAISTTDLKIAVVGGRTNSSGTGLTDLTAEEARFPAKPFTEGVFGHADAFEVTKGTSWNILIGSGSSKTDYAIIEGDFTGQGNYIVRLESQETIAISAADPSLPRRDEVYIVVLDDPYDSQSRGRAALAVQEGTAAGSPTWPGADASWEAYHLLCRIEVPAGASGISGCTLYDQRSQAGLALPGTIEGGEFSTGGGDFDLGSGNLTTTGLVDGVDVSTHDHSGAGEGGTIDAGDLTGLQTAVNAANVDADTLDGEHASAFADAAHGHTLTGGSNITVTPGGSPGDYTIAHQDTSSQASVDNSNGSVIQDVTLDGHGHVTALGSINLDTRYYTEAEINASWYTAAEVDSILGGYLTTTAQAADSAKLGGVAAANFLRADIADTANGRITFEDGTIIKDGGATLIQAISGNVTIAGASLNITNLPYNNTYGSLRLAGGSAAVGDIYQAMYSSSEVYKEDIEDYNPSASRFAQLRPVSFHYVADHPMAASFADWDEYRALTHYGFIIEEYAEVFPEFAHNVNTPEEANIAYEAMIPELLADYTATRAHLLAKVAELEERLAALEG